MKTSYVLLFLLLANHAFGQVHENFDDGNFYESPVWRGDSSFFRVINGELQSQGPAANSILHLQCSNSRIINTEWTFYVRLEFDPSSTNYAKIYLSSDQADLENSLNGYFIKIGGETGTADGIDLYKQEGTITTKLIDGISGHAGKSINSLRIKVIRDIDGIWKLLSDTLGGQNFLPEGTAFDNEFTESSFYGIVCVHSSTRKDLFYFDDFLIEEAPLSVAKTSVINDRTIEISFNKGLDKISSENTANYEISTIGNPISATLVDSSAKKILLNLPLSLQNQLYTIAISHIKDLDGNSIALGTTVSFTYNKPLLYGDIIISEIFPDPSPSAGLPEEEFIEVFNNTSDTIDLSRLSFCDATNSVKLPLFKLQPSGYCILTSNSSLSEFENYGPVIGLPLWPSLNNSSDKLSLKDEYGKIIFGLAYSDTWYKDPLKKEGGWTLEIANPKEFCAENENWKVSEDILGGSPGKINSIATSVADLTPPQLLELTVLDPMSLLLRFDETLDTLLSVSNFIIDPYTSITKINKIDNQTISLILTSSLQVKTRYQLRLESIKDCKGNVLLAGVIEFLLAESSDSLDIVINEILFNPLTGGSDFVEIYNRSDKIIDLKNWKIGTLKKDTLSELKVCSSSSTLLFPGNFICFTPDVDFLKTHYNVPYPERVLPMQLPSFSDDLGTVVLVNPEQKTVDRFDYREDYHFPLIDNKEGISLERLSLYAPSNHPHNWHSAAETAGWATPGYENSQAKEGYFPKPITIDPKVFTPDQDAMNDYTSINYRLSDPGFVGTISIYDVKGRKIKVLANNHLLGREGFFQWDGTNEEGQLASIGYYIILFEAYNLKGEVSNYKETVVLAKKF